MKYCLDKSNRIVLFNEKGTPIWQSIDSFLNLKKATIFLRNLKNNIFLEVYDKRLAYIIYQGKKCFDTHELHKTREGKRGWENPHKCKIDGIPKAIYEPKYFEKLF